MNKLLQYVYNLKNVPPHEDGHIFFLDLINAKPAFQHDHDLFRSLLYIDRLIELREYLHLQLLHLLLMRGLEILNFEVALDFLQLNRQ